ncbi:hypothetical protein [Dactylosporangium sp. NPDC049140]
MTPRRSLARRLLPWILVIGFAAWIIVIAVLITADPAGSAG